MVFKAHGENYRSSTLIHEMVLNVRDVALWFRDATSDRRLEALCRLIDCCMPPELQFLNTYLDEMLRRNCVANQQLDSNMPELHEITDSTCRRQLCLILTRLKSASVLAGCIYDILIQYNFSEFFSRVMVMEEELVDEILLLFTLAANHPAMTFSQRRNLHQRLVDLRETIAKSFKCYQATDVCLQYNQEYVCKPLEKSSTKEMANTNEKHSMAELPKTDLNMEPGANSENVPASRNMSEAHIKDLRVVRVQQRPLDKKYEYIFEVTWSNGKVVRIHRAYGELFDFQCKLRRRYSKEVTSKMTDRKVIIPYLPARRSIKVCKGNQILPDITHYVREFTKLPDKLLHSESVENFFSDGMEKHLDEKQNTSKTKQVSNHEKKDNTNVTCKHNDTPRISVDVKFDQGTGSMKNHSPKGKCPASLAGKKFNNSLQTAGKLESKKRPPLVSRNNTSDTAVSLKDGNKAKTTHNQPRAILKSPHPPATQLSIVPEDKTQTINKESKRDFSLLNGDHFCTETNAESLAERTTNDDADLKATSDDNSIQDTTTNDLIQRTDLNTAQRIDTPISTTCTVIPNNTSTHLPSTTSLVMSVSPIPYTVSSSSSLTNVTASFSSSSTVTSILTLTLSSAMTSSLTTSTMTSPRLMSAEFLTANSESPMTMLLSSAPTLSTVTSSALSSRSSTDASSSTPTIMISSIVTSSTLSPTTSSTSSMITSRTPSIMTPSLVTSPTTPDNLTVKFSQVPLTVAVPLLSPPCITCPISNQSSSDGSLTSSLSRTPLSSPVYPRTPESAGVKISFDKDTFNGVVGTCLTSAKSVSVRTKLCQCEKFENVQQDSTEDEVLLDPSCDMDSETTKVKNREKQKLKAAHHHLRSTPVCDKNGYTRSHNNLSRHGLLIVPNGYNYVHLHPGLNYCNYDCHSTVEQTLEDDLYEEGFASHGVKTNDKNCNYIYQNGGHHEMLDFNSNKSYDCNSTPYLNEKSNGLSKPFCYNCGEYGHLGNLCVEEDREEFIVS